MVWRSIFNNTEIKYLGENENEKVLINFIDCHKRNFQFFSLETTNTRLSV